MGRRPVEKQAAMAVAIILVLLIVGSVMFHFLSPWWWTPIASNWRYIDNTIIITFWITGVVFAAVVLFMAYCVFRFRHREGNRAAYEPENKRLEWWLTDRHRGRGRGDAGARPVRLEPVRHRSRATRPRSRSSASNGSGASACPARTASSARPTRATVIADNPLGVDPERSQRAGRVMVEAADLHLPVGKPVKMLLRSIDVLHDFYVPEFRAKMDMIPGTVTYFWFTPTRTGTFEVLCAELCGMGHPHDARQRRGRRPSRTTRPGSAQQQTFAQLSAAGGEPGRQTPARQTTERVPKLPHCSKRRAR